MPFIRTVLGDVPPGDLGVCYAHEHLVIDASYTTEKNPDFLLDDVDRIADEVAAFRAAGGRALVDSMPCDCGRNVEKLAAVARRAAVHVLAPTGLHLPKYYPPGHWGAAYTADQLADLFTAEITAGVDLHSYGGPIVERTSHRAGLVKIATGGERLTDHERKVFEAAAETHRRTGCPILTHTEQGAAALEQAACLEEQGVDLAHVVLSHTDRRPDFGYHREILSTGVCVEYDSAFRRPDPDRNPTRDLVLGLIEDFPDQIMLGMDAARRGYWRVFGGAPGLTYLLTTFTDDLRAHGLTDAQWARIFVRTPAAAYRFADR